MLKGVKSLKALAKTFKKKHFLIKLFSKKFKKFKVYRASFDELYYSF